VGQQGVLNQLALRARRLAEEPGCGTLPYAVEHVLLDTIWCAPSPLWNFGRSSSARWIRTVGGMA